MDQLKSLSLTTLQILIAAAQVGYAFHKTTAFAVGSAVFVVLLAARAILIEAAGNIKNV